MLAAAHAENVIFIGMLVKNYSILDGYDTKSYMEVILCQAPPLYDHYITLTGG